MKKIALLFASVLVFGMSLSVNAEMKVGFVSDEKLSSFLKEKNEAKVFEEFGGRFSRLESEKNSIPQLKKSFNLLYEHKGKKPTSAEQQEFDLKIKKIESEYPVKSKELGEEHRKRLNEEAKKIKELAMKTIRSIGEKEKFSAIFTNSSALYVDPGCGSCGLIDITDKVIKELSNAQ